MNSPSTSGQVWFCCPRQALVYAIRIRWPMCADWSFKRLAYACRPLIWTCPVLLALEVSHYQDSNFGTLFSQLTMLNRCGGCHRYQSQMHFGIWQTYSGPLRCASFIHIETPSLPIDLYGFRHLVPWFMSSLNACPKGQVRHGRPTPTTVTGH